MSRAPFVHRPHPAGRAHLPGRRHRAAGPAARPGPGGGHPPARLPGHRRRVQLLVRLLRHGAPRHRVVHRPRHPRPRPRLRVRAGRPLGGRPADARSAMAWVVGTWGTGTDRATHAAVMLVLHDLMGASYPFGRLDVDRLTTAGLAGFEGHEAEVLQRARTIKADGLAHAALRGRLHLTMEATPIDAHGIATVRLAVRDDAGQGAAGVVLVLDGAGAGWPEPRLTTGKDGTLTVAAHPTSPRRRPSAPRPSSLACTSTRGSPPPGRPSASPGRRSSASSPRRARTPSRPRRPPPSRRPPRPRTTSTTTTVAPTTTHRPPPSRRTTTTRRRRPARPPPSRPHHHRRPDHTTTSTAPHDVDHRRRLRSPPPPCPPGAVAGRRRARRRACRAPGSTP